ncbi:MAG: hypothetical protein KUL83_04475 [Lentimicrobium sp.]|jgi:hypothetical protein|nr:hypothetical protein [Lentimicrobium sp.]MDD2526801.1 hypothetical protein [Lentimicrobiaceae bacterium]MDD4597900.1 hypothetical protein [Lentimicrobiaceae bacterium]MDY0024414.1 hypothetical protein [Lentimicrobium sp.]
MEKRGLSSKTIFVITAIAIAAAFRIVPHWPNFTPVAAMALFAGATINRKWLAFMLPLAALFLSDLVLGFHSTIIFVYGAMILTVLIGSLLSKKLKAGNIAIATVSSSILFFLVTNFGAWMSGMLPYTRDFSGLMQAYIAGIPFFNTALAGDLFYSGVLFGSFILARKRFPRLVKA